MERVLTEQVFAEFDERLRHVLPSFTKEAGEGIPKECRVYKGRTQKLVFFIQIQVHRSEDSFTVEVAWSQKNRWPVAFNVEAISPEKPLPEEARFRLCRLWLDADVWWQIKPLGFIRGALARTRPDPVASLVEDSIQRLLEHALPYFRRVAVNLGEPLNVFDVSQ